MIITSTEVQNNFGKYLRLAEQEDIIITKNGKKVARLVKFSENDDYIIREGSSAYGHEGMQVSYEEFLKIARESENRYEYIDGEIYLLASPKVKHQKIVMIISNRFSSWFESKKCFPLTSPLDVTLYKDGKPNVVQPDLLVICDQENIKADDTYMGTPALVVEVLSESTRSKDMIKKLDLYMQGGVEEYWIVNPLSEEINVYWFKEREIENTKTFKKGERAESFAFPGLSVEVDTVFG
ncbi:MAG: type II toxin-antitoxin system Phd/YefM family antitoxin [Firmicutes bacterium]|nr:type II toxin-antitoxin system Phd/YefM family antitoxin [Bacillota bacterium]